MKDTQKWWILILCGMASATGSGLTAEPGAERKGGPSEGSGWHADAAVFIPKSVFELPSGPEEGRDPFFPKSARLFAGKKTASNPSPPVALSLSLRGLAGVPGRRLATLRTAENPPRSLILAEGEERTVYVQGGEVRIRCVQITDDRVLVEVNGLRQELQLRDGI